MREIIQALVQLQRIDTEVYKVSATRDKLVSKLEQLKSVVERYEQALKEKKEKLKQVQRWYEEQMETVREHEERMKKLQAALNKSTKTKEYLAYQRELDNVRKQKQAREDEAAKVLEAIHEFEETIADDEQTIAKMKEETEQEKGSSWKQIQELEKQFAAYEAQRRKLLPRIPEKYLRKYELIKSRREGKAIVPVVNYCCSGCHVTIRPQQYNVLLTFQKLETCPSCNRFIYVDQEGIEESSDASEQKVE